jgi:D-alanyl-D-alanine carboxypeptidase
MTRKPAALTSAALVCLAVACGNAGGQTAAASITPATTPASAARAADLPVTEAEVRQAAQALVSKGARQAIAAVQDRGRLVAAAVPDAAAPTRQMVRIGSATKMFTAAIVLQLVHEGRIKLDAPAGRYLPLLGEAGRQITIRELLQHRSGLPDYTAYASWMKMADASATIGPRDCLRFALSHPLLFPPGSQWSYSNTNYIALGLIVEAVTRHPFAAELAARITGPLGLRSTLLPTTRTVPGLADDPGINPGVPWTAGGIVSTAHDLARFLSALIAGRLLAPAELTEMEQAVPTPLGFGYGLGLMTAQLPCGPVLGHEGGTLDYGTQAWATADGRRVLILLTRGGGTSASPVPTASATAQPATAASSAPQPSLLCP